MSLWFKSLQPYRLSRPLGLSSDELAAALEPARFRPCGPQETLSEGFVAPWGEALVYEQGGYRLLALQTETRTVPASVLRDWVAAKAAEIEGREARPVGRKERANLKDEALQALLPRAFPRTHVTRAYISPDGWLVVDAPSAARAEALLSRLRSALGSLPVLPLQVATAPSALFTAWLSGQVPVPADFVLGEEAELIDPAEDGGIIRARRQDLAAEEMREHLAAGKQAVKLAVSWDETLAAVLTAEPALRRLRFADTVQERLADLDGADAAALFAGQFALMVLELARCLPRLVEVLGGEVGHE